MARKPELWAALGARGTGKSAWVRREVERLRPARLAVWDLMREHQAAVVTDDLGEALRAMGGRRWSVAFRPAGDPKRRAAQFDLWCRGLMAAGDCLALVEELAFVTQASKAPPAWAEVCLLGRHRGVSVIGTSQRPASVDKAFLGNVDLVHAGRQAYEADARTVGQLVGVPWAELMTLPDLHWIERRAGATEARRGVLTFDRPAPRSGATPKAPDLRAGRARGESRARHQPPESSET